MKVELLSKLFPKSLDMTSIGSGKSNDAVTPDEISAQLSYLNLNEEEIDVIFAKYFNDDNSKSKLFKVYIKLVESNLNNLKQEDIEKVTECILLESFIRACPFCNGIGSIVNKNRINKCYHCNNSGIFIFDDNTRRYIMKLNKKNYDFIKDIYVDLVNSIGKKELTALNKIGVL